MDQRKSHANRVLHMPTTAHPDKPRPHSNLLVLCQGTVICLGLALLNLSFVTVVPESRMSFAKLGLWLVGALFLFGLPVAIRTVGLARLGWIAILFFGTSEGIRYLEFILSRR